MQGKAHALMLDKGQLRATMDCYDCSVSILYTKSIESLLSHQEKVEGESNRISHVED